MAKVNVLDAAKKQFSRPAAAPPELMADMVREGLPLPNGEFLNVANLSDRELKVLQEIGVENTAKTPAQLREILAAVADQANVMAPSLLKRGLGKAGIRKALENASNELTPDEQQKLQGLVREFSEQNAVKATQKPDPNMRPDIAQALNTAPQLRMDEPEEVEEETEVVIPPSTTTTAPPVTVKITDEDLTAFVMGMASDSRFTKTYSRVIGGVDIRMTFRELVNSDTVYLSRAVRTDYEAKKIVSMNDREQAVRLYLLLASLVSIDVGSDSTTFLTDLRDLDDVDPESPFDALQSVIEASPLRRETIIALAFEFSREFSFYTQALVKKIYSPNS